MLARLVAGICGTKSITGVPTGVPGATATGILSPFGPSERM